MGVECVTVALPSHGSVWPSSAVGMLRAKPLGEANPGQPEEPAAGDHVEEGHRQGRQAQVHHRHGEPCHRPARPDAGERQDVEQQRAPSGPADRLAERRRQDQDEARHAVVGLGDEPAARRHGLVQSPGSAPVTVDVPVPGAGGTTVPALATVVFGINPSGAIVGQYVAAAGGAPHGFVAFPVGK